MWPFTRRANRKAYGPVRTGECEGADPCMVAYTIAVVPVRPVVRAIIGLLNQHPEEWHFSGHDALHTGGACVHIVSEYDWTTTLALPGLGQVVRESEARKATREQRALFAAVRSVQDRRATATGEAYVSRAAGARGDRRRQLNEDARRADFEAESLGIAAQRARAMAADARRAAEGGAA